MAIVEYKDANGDNHWADENSKAYERHLRDQDTSQEAPKVEKVEKAEIKSPAVNSPVTLKPKD